MPYYQRNILVLSTTTFLAAVSWQQVMPFLPKFLKELGAGDQAMVWAYTAFIFQAIASIFGMPFWGKVADTVGRKPMIIRAGIFLTGIYFAMSFCTVPWHVVACRFLNGLLTGFIPGSFALIATNTPSERAPRYIALAQTATSVGVIVGPMLGGQLAEVVGYKGSMMLSGAAVFLSTIMVWLLVQEPNKGTTAEKTSMFQDMAEGARSPMLRSLMFAMMVAAIYGNAIGPVLALHLDKLLPQISDRASGVVFALPAIAFIVTAQLWTRIGERRGFPGLLFVGLLGGGACALGLAIAPSIWLFASIYFVSGLLMASISPAAGALICLRVDETFRGRAYAMQNAASWVGALVGLLAALGAGALFGSRGIFCAVGVSLLLGAVGYRALIRCKPKEQQACDP